MTDREPPSFGAYRPNAAGESQSRLRLDPRLANYNQGSGQQPRPAAYNLRADTPRRGSLLNAVLWIFGGGLALLAVSSVLFIAFAPTDLVRDQLIAQVKAYTGRNLVVEGQTSLSFFPSLAVTMGDVSLSAPSKMAGPPTVRMQQLQVNVPLLPLIRRQVQIEQLVLTRPVVELHIDKAGRKSWELSADASSPRIQYAQAGTTRTDAGAPIPSGGNNALGSIEDVSLGDVRIVDGVVRYRDDRGGTSEEIRGLDLALKGNRLADPLGAQGNLVWRGERLGFLVDLSTPKALLAEQPARVSMQITGRRLSSRLDGGLVAGAKSRFDGQLALDTRSLRDLALWLGISLPKSRGMGQLNLSGRLVAHPETLSLNGAQIALDTSKAAGDLTVGLSGMRPDIRANLSIDVLDLNNYTSGEEAIGSRQLTEPAATAKSTTQVKPGTGEAKLNSIDELLRRDAETKPVPGRFSPQVRGYTKSTDWSEQHIDLASLKAVDMTASVAIGQLIYEQIKVGRTSVDMTLRSGMMQALLKEMALYDGRGNGQVRLDAREAQPRVSAIFSLEGLAALSFLKDAADFDWLDGKARIQFSVEGHGQSQKSIMSALSGKAAVSFTDGAIVGYNIPKMIRGLQQERISGLDRLPSEKTDFSSLTATYQIANGVAVNKDLKLISPLLRVEGEGNVNIGAQQLDYLMRPKIVASLSGQNGSANPTGIEVPVRINGPWAKPKISPDLHAVLKNPSSALQTIKQLGDQIKAKKGVSEALKNLFGNRN